MELVTLYELLIILLKTRNKSRSHIYVNEYIDFISFAHFVSIQ